MMPALTTSPTAGGAPQEAEAALALSVRVLIDQLLLGQQDGIPAVVVDGPAERQWLLDALTAEAKIHGIALVACGDAARLDQDDVSTRAEDDQALAFLVDSDQAVAFGEWLNAHCDRLRDLARFVLVFVGRAALAAFLRAAPDFFSLVKGKIIENLDPRRPVITGDEAERALLQFDRRAAALRRAAKVGRAVGQLQALEASLRHAPLQTPEEILDGILTLEAIEALRLAKAPPERRQAQEGAGAVDVAPEEKRAASALADARDRLEAIRDHLYLCRHCLLASLDHSSEAQGMPVEWLEARGLCEEGARLVAAASVQAATARLREHLGACAKCAADSCSLCSVGVVLLLVRAQRERDEALREREQAVLALAALRKVTPSPDRCEVKP